MVLLVSFHFIFYVLNLHFVCISSYHSSYSLLWLGRRVLIFPKGNNVDNLSMYLDVADSTSLPYGWSRYAQFSLAVVNQIHNKYSVRKGAPLMHSLYSSLGLFSFLLGWCWGISTTFMVLAMSLGMDCRSHESRSNILSCSDSRNSHMFEGLSKMHALVCWQLGLALLD